MVTRVTNALTGEQFDFDDTDSVAIGYRGKILYFLESDYKRTRETSEFKILW